MKLNQKPPPARLKLLLAFYKKPSILGSSATVAYKLAPVVAKGYVGQAERKSNDNYNNFQEPMPETHLYV